VSGVSRRVGGALALLVTAALGVGAGYIAFSSNSATEASPANDPLTVAAVNGSVGRSIPVAVTVTQPFGIIATNSLAGVVTGVGTTSVGQGDTLFEVAGVPVHAIEGDTPMYRDLAKGVKGKDVAQLQRALTELGFPLVDDGDFGGRTLDAVKAWQRSLGEEATGIVRLGTILVLPQLPTTVRLGERIAAGLQVSGGEDAILVHADAPRFTVGTTAEVASQVPANATVVVQYDGSSWDAIVASSHIDSNGQPELELTGADGGPPCADACDSLPAEDAISLTGALVIAADVTGVVVPIAAVQVDASGATSVVLDDGTNVPVTVVASQDGRAVVEGIAAGQRVLVAEPRS